MMTNLKIQDEMYAVKQELTANEMCDQLWDSKAMVEAYQANDFTSMADIIRQRLNTYAKRIAEMRVDGKITTKWVDSSDELDEYRLVRLERFEDSIRQKKAVV
jgi:triphosphoribosyl-dephospho-CoA synthetase